MDELLRCRDEVQRRSRTGSLVTQAYPHVLLEREESFPSLAKRGEGRFSDKCPFNHETLNTAIQSLWIGIHYPAKAS